MDLSTGIASPVIMASLQDEEPDTTTPSTGMEAPGKTFKTSLSWTSEMEMG